MIRAIRENLSPSKMMIDGEFHACVPECHTTACRHVATKIKYYYMKSSCIAFTHKDVNVHAIPCLRAGMPTTACRHVPSNKNY